MKPVATETAAPPLAGIPQDPSPPVDRRGTILVWAPIGLVLVAMALTVWAQWLLSGSEFGAVPITGPDEYPGWREVALRITEALSFLEMAVLIWFVAVRPLRREGKLGLDAKITAGCLLGSVSDGFLNTQDYLFAWNQHSIDFGSWSSFMPFASDDHLSRYAEGIVWGTPMYTYFCIGVAIAGVALIKRLRRSYPDISNAAALSVVFALAVLFDFVMENLIIRVDYAYAFAQTPGSLTFWSGSQFQFPIYEAICVGLLGVFFTQLRLSGHDSADGLSWPERGIQRVRPAWQGAASWFAVIGAAMAALILIYHLPFNWFGMIGDSAAELPSYMLPTG